jgi:Asp/Glu/hydantoin racemase
MRFYSMGYREVMELPISVFWNISSHIERIRAEEDLRQFRAMANSNGGDGVSEYLDDLNEKVGKVFVFDPTVAAKVDEEGLADLRNMAQQKLGEEVRK